MGGDISSWCARRFANLFRVTADVVTFGAASNKKYRRNERRLNVQELREKAGMKSEFFSKMMDAFRMHENTNDWRWYTVHRWPIWGVESPKTPKTPLEDKDKSAHSEHMEKIYTVLLQNEYGGFFDANDDFKLPLNLAFREAEDVEQDVKGDGTMVAQIYDDVAQYRVGSTRTYTKRSDRDEVQLPTLLHADGKPLEALKTGEEVFGYHYAMNKSRTNIVAVPMTEENFKLARSAHAHNPTLESLV